MPLDDLDSLSPLPLLEGLSSAQDNAQSALQRKLGLLRNNFIGLAVERSALGVSKNNPRDPSIDEVVRGGLTSVGSRDVESAILSRELHVRCGIEKLLEGDEVDGRRSDYDLCGLAKE